MWRAPCAARAARKALDLRKAKALSLITASGGTRPSAAKCSIARASTPAAGILALVTVLLDVGIATVVVDHAVQVDVADSGPLLSAGQGADAGDRVPRAIETRQAGDVDVQQAPGRDHS
jgi:hypothetical protein